MNNSKNDILKKQVIYHSSAMRTGKSLDVLMILTWIHVAYGLAA